MNWPVVGIAIAVVSFVIARIWLRRWIVRRWLDDDLTNWQAAALLLLTHYSPMILFVAIILINSPEALPFFALLILLFAPISIATWGVLMDYTMNHGLKERMQRDRHTRLQSPDR